jgi:hypothetical protein
MFPPHRSPSLIIHAWVIAAAGLLHAGPLAETWQTGYIDKDATGPHVLGYWQFAAAAPNADSSGKGHVLTFAGAVAVAEDKHDGALESFPGFPVQDKRHAAVSAAAPGLSPKGAFTLEMWIKPKPEFDAELSSVLMDKKYVAHTDYQWRLTPGDKSGARRMQVILGFGADSETFYSELFAPGTDWQHLAFTYDGAGAVRFYHNGSPLGGGDKLARGAVVPGKHVLSIGDRVGSNYAGFPGFIDEVRICDGVLGFRPVSVTFDVERQSWLRMEKAGPVRVQVQNLRKTPTKDLTLRLSLEGLGAQDFQVPELAAGAIHTVEYPFDTALRPDTYRLQAHLEMPGAMPFTSDEFTEISIAARPLTKMPVVLWGLGSPSSVREEMPRLKDLGFTHALGRGADYGTIWTAKKPVPSGSEEQIAEMKAMLDFALTKDFGIAFALSPGGWLKDREEFQRVDRKGQPSATRPDVNAAMPGLADFCFNVGASIAQTYRAYPAWQAALINTEVRDSSQVSFSEFDHAAYRKFSGVDIPAEVTIKNGVEWSKLKDFPADRVIPDKHPLLNYYRWFWTVGDGWNALHTATHRGIHSTGRDDVWTWFDPSIRAPSIGGSGGEVDVLGQWTYTNPDPLRIAYFTDEVFAMAANSPQRPDVMKMTQLFWYRTQSAPQKAGATAIASPFDDHDPDAAYITISPMHLRESFWTKLARPVSGIMYHGWQALVPTDSVGGYRYTQPDTKEEFRRLHRDVLEPLGPTLLKVGDRQSDVAYLDSFTSQMFARRGSYGYSGDDAYRTVLHAQLQPQVIYDEQVLAKPGLDPFKILVLASCDVLTESLAKRIHEFQKRGGIVIGDENLAPAIKPDIRLAKITRTKNGAENKAAVLAAAAQLRSALADRYTRPAENSNPEIVPRLRTAGASDYVFVVNDHREFGSYVGQHGLVMENGVPSTGEMTLDRADGHIYDLIAHHEIPATKRDKKLHWPVDLGPCDGRVYLISPEPITTVKVAAPETATSGSAVPIRIEIADPAGKPVPAVVPVQLEITDPAGRRAEFSGYHAAEGGQLALNFQFAQNDTPGVWRIHAQELASGKESTHYVRLSGPAFP